ncbi:MAG: PKD domain-containing protein, partial [Candidatus Marinimicrobia bacterium]|nr:PKD domain-containing protein [Candidatus Neomarinimicrobiota bacterium]
MAQFELTDPAGFKTTRFDGDLVFKSNQKAIQRQQQAAAFRKHPVVTRANTVLQSVAIFMRFMTTSQENTWKSYKEFWAGFRSFYNAFIKNNVQKQYPFTFSIDSVMGITSPPQIPNTPHDFTAGYCSTIDRILLEWQYDTPGDAYVGAAFKRMVPGVQVNLDNIRIIGGDLAALEFYEVPDTLLSYSAKILMTIRYCNMRGEVSPWCDPIIVELPDPPDVDFSGTPLSDVSPLTVMFSNLTTGSASRYLWKFGDGETSTEKNPTHTYDGPEASFTVSLTSYGCANSKRTKTKRTYVHIIDDLTYDTIA